MTPQLCLASLLCLISCGCQSAFEWKVHLHAITDEVQPPGEPASARGTTCTSADTPSSVRESHGAKDAGVLTSLSGKPSTSDERKQLPLRWETVEEKLDQPFDRLPGYGSNQVKAIARDGVRLDSVPNASAGATKTPDGTRLMLFARSQRQRFFHSLSSTVDASLELELSKGHGLFLYVDPYIASDFPPDKRDESSTDITGSFPRDKSGAALVISFHPSWNRLVCLDIPDQNLPKQISPERALIRVSLRSGSLGVCRMSPIEVAIQLDQVYVVNLPKQTILQMDINNDGRAYCPESPELSEPKSRGFVAVHISSYHDCLREHQLFTQSLCYGNEQLPTWEAWNEQWRQKATNDPQKDAELRIPSREQTVTAQILLELKGAFQQKFRGM